MDRDQLRAICLEQPGAFEDFPFGTDTAVIKVRARPDGAVRMFALLWQDAHPTRANLKCEPALAEQLRAAHAEITPGYHMSKKHWNTVLCAGSLDDATVRDLVEDSYDLVVERLPLPDRQALGWQRLSRGLGRLEP